MVEKKECRYFYYKNKETSGFDKPISDIIKMPMCKINKMTVGGCHEDCKWFEPKIP